MNLRNILKRFSMEELRQAIRYARSDSKRTKLEAEAASLRKALAKVEAKLAKLGGSNGTPVTSTRGRKPGRRKGYKLSPATRNRMRIAALKRYAGKAKAEAPAKVKRTRKPLSAEAKEKGAPIK